MLETRNEKPTKSNKIEEEEVQDEDQRSYNELDPFIK
jgi:hypothetical protein